MYKITNDQRSKEFVVETHSSIQLAYSIYIYVNGRKIKEMQTDIRKSDGREGEHMWTTECDNAVSI